MSTYCNNVNGGGGGHTVQCFALGAKLARTASAQNGTPNLLVTCRKKNSVWHTCMLAVLACSKEHPTLSAARKNPQHTFILKQHHAYFVFHSLKNSWEIYFQTESLFAHVQKLCVMQRQGWWKAVGWESSMSISGTWGRLSMATVVCALEEVLIWWAEGRMVTGKGEQTCVIESTSSHSEVTRHEQKVCTSSRPEGKILISKHPK